MRRTSVTKRRIDELLRFLPLFEDPGAAFVERWHGGRRPDGVIVMPYPEYSAIVGEFFELALGPYWNDRGYNPGEAGAMLEDDEAIGRASLAEVRAMLTYCVRGERFCDGHREAMLRSGRVVALLRRLRVLRDSVA